MAWYDVFAHAYDASLEPLYAEHRALAAEALQLSLGLRVLDAPCGTGQSFAALAARIGSDGVIVGADLSAGMLRKAERRSPESQVELHHADAGALRVEPVDALHVFLGMSVFDDMDATFDALWARLRPGGRCVLVDVFAASLGLQGRMVNLMARADIRRRFWAPLEAVSEGFELRDLPRRAAHGGQIRLASGRKPLLAPAQA